MGRKIIGLLGSPLEHGNTAKLLDQALKGASDAGCETEKIIVPFLDFEPCMEMMFCREHEICQIEDGMTPMYAKIPGGRQPDHCDPHHDDGNSGKTKRLYGPVPGILHG